MFRSNGARFTSIELCAGGGGQALGLEQAGFDHLALVEIDQWSCRTLKANRPAWNVIQGDLRQFRAHTYRGQVDLVAGGVPCPPFSKAGMQLGDKDERNMFPEALRIVRECDPKAVMIENVRGLMDPVFGDYRETVSAELRSMGYESDWKLLNASDFGVPQLRPRVVLVALKHELFPLFQWPRPSIRPAPTVGEALRDDIGAAGWEGADAWAEQANTIAPTLVGGSHKHGGPDLGPTRARKAWADLGVDGLGLANEPPQPGFSGKPKITVEMTARLQGFPREWRFEGKKTPAYRQVGNAFPPPVAAAVGNAIACALEQGTSGTRLMQGRLCLHETIYAATS
jgi:DNA (cytosine-5)-methyltransferase 1